MHSEIKITLPWPPSSNTYWRRRGSTYFISTKGQNYRTETAWTCHKFRGSFSADKRLKVSILAYPPDKRKRDLDNLFKAVLDSLQYATIFVDDSQIDDLTIRRMSEHTGIIEISLGTID